MEYVRDSDDTAYLARSRELAFLANTLMAGCSFSPGPLRRRKRLMRPPASAIWVSSTGRRAGPTPRRAMRSTADLGATLPDTFLMDHDLVTAFEVGWAVLHEDVSMFVAEQLIFTLTDLRCGDAEHPERAGRPAARAREAA